MIGIPLFPHVSATATQTQPHFAVLVLTFFLQLLPPRAVENYQSDNVHNELTRIYSIQYNCREQGHHTSWTQRLHYSTSWTNLEVSNHSSNHSTHAAALLQYRSPMVERSLVHGIMRGTAAYRSSSDPQANHGHRRTAC